MVTLAFPQMGGDTTLAPHRVTQPLILVIVGTASQEVLAEHVCQLECGRGVSLLVQVSKFLQEMRNGECPKIKLLYLLYIHNSEISTA